jgi:ABC-type sulfate transport system substrate-binding protein
MASGQVVQIRPNIGYSFEQLTVTSGVQVLTPTKYKDSVTSGGASSAFLTNYGNAIRYSYDNITTPSATVGHVLQDGGILTLNGQNQMGNFKCYAISGDSEISITYERE